MNSSDLLDNAWTIFLMVGLVLCALGLFRGGIRGRNARSDDRVPMNLTLVWAGVIVLGLGGVFGLGLGVVRANWFGIVLSVIQLAVYAYIIVTLIRIQRRPRTSTTD